MSCFARPLVSIAMLVSFVLFASLGSSADAQGDKKEDTKSDVKKDDVKKDDVKKDDVKKDVKKDDVKKDDVKKDDVKKDVKKDTKGKKAAKKDDAAKKDETKKDETKKDETKKDDAKKDDAKKDDKKEVKEEPKKEPFVPDTPLADLKMFAEKAEGDLKANRGAVYHLEFLDDGKTLVSVGDRTIRFWDFAARKEREKDRIKDLPSEAKSLAVGGGKIYVGTGKWNKEKKGWEGEIKIIDAVTLKPSGSLKGHSETIESLAVSKDGKILASASEDQTAKLWDLGASKEGVGFKGHTQGILAIALSPDGTKAATASKDGSVKIWNVADGKDIATIKSTTEVTKVDPKTKKETKTTNAGRDYTCLVFSKDGKTLVAGNLDADGDVRLIDVEGGKVTASHKVHGGVWSVAVSPDGSKYATGGYDHCIRIWDTAGKELAMIKAHDKTTVTTLAFSPDNQFLVSGGFDGSIKIWPAMKK